MKSPLTPTPKPDKCFKRNLPMPFCCVLTLIFVELAPTEPMTCFNRMKLVGGKNAIAILGKHLCLGIIQTNSLHVWKRLFILPYAGRNEMFIVSFFLLFFAQVSNALMSLARKNLEALTSVWFHFRFLSSAPRTLISGCHNLIAINYCHPGRQLNCLSPYQNGERWEGYSTSCVIWCRPVSCL